ncbi:metal-dependent hydrolase [Mucilaginibacter sp. L3T2-6]|uniref:metal-dependent hydrolase n=1 Tax=Mucilaginibacter sp. L3T2-6 TaxID=3062491 RepID=UPI002675C917|nr:metal-dependent hydrolase [Mucilaginibacter sp. L3T2-6]MDO3643663.1 metal-dependent hydrolase [Mucilaginibacter sp. L3T2-6]MDV6216089.1 metal-dependent hydrolase [Mucilaginibacter sp. L3T2-6]
MDTITHLALGACMGEAFAGEKLGRRALLWGALAHGLPDIDFVSSLWLPAPAALLAHRGITHSFIFCAAAAPAMAISVRRLQTQRAIRWVKWALFFGLMILLHDGLDALNNYGVGWFEPFSQARISFNTIYVADPFFTIWPLGACIALLCFGKNRTRKKAWLYAGLGISCLYLIYCGANKVMTERAVRKLLDKQNIVHTRYFTTPAPLQTWLWYIVAGNDSGYFVGYRSVFDRKQQLGLRYFPRNTFLLGKEPYSNDLKNLLRFSQQFYTVELRKDTLVFNDLRFGQVIGWQNPDAGFVFHYFLEYPQQNKLVVQRGRFTGWSWQTTRSLFQRIRGN